VYVIGALGVLHFLWLAKKGRTTPYYYAIALAVLLGVRAWDWSRKKLAKRETLSPNGGEGRVRGVRL
jgi:sulfoxide reductase heme-binding subunit YedZ